MQITQVHSHLNGHEHLLIHKPDLWREMVAAVESVDPDFRESDNRAIEESTPNGRYNAARLTDGLRSQLLDLGWHADEASCLVRDRVAVRLRFGEPGTGVFGSATGYLESYVGDVIDVGVEILPMKSLQAQMSSGIAYFEGELYNVLRHGRGTPAVPLVLIGVAP